MHAHLVLRLLARADFNTTGSVLTFWLRDQLEADRQYFVRMAAISEGGQGNWTAARGFRTLRWGPEVRLVDVVSPTAVRVRLLAAAPHSLPADLQEFRVQLSSRADFSQDVEWRQFPSSAADWVYTLHGLHRPGKYFVRVQSRATGDTGMCVFFSVLLFFTCLFSLFLCSFCPLCASDVVLLCPSPHCCLMHSNDGFWPLYRWSSFNNTAAVFLITPPMFPLSQVASLFLAVLSSPHELAPSSHCLSTPRS